MHPLELWSGQAMASAAHSIAGKPCSYRSRLARDDGLAGEANGALENRGVIAQLDLYRFDAGEVVQRADAVLTAHARLLVAADWHLGVGLAPGVDPADTGFQLMNHAVGAVQVTGDDASGQ